VLIAAGVGALLVSLALAGRPGVSPSRRWLACALALAVPGPGLVLALIVRRTRGGQVALEPELDELPPRLSPVDVARLGEMPPVLDRLLGGDPAERLEALLLLASTADAAAVAILRWAVEHGPPEVVPDAALTLEEIDLRGEARLAALRASLESSDPDRLIGAGDAAAGVVIGRIAEATLVPAIAEYARACYHRALDVAPERAREVGEKLARLELAAGRPRVALEIVDRLIVRDDAELAQLRDDCAFAARDFDTLSFLPRPLDPPAELSARSLQTLLT